MSEQRLRDLLQQAVPEAPDLDPAAVGRRAERARRHRLAVVAGSAAAVLAIAVSPVVLEQLADRDAARPAPLIDVAPTATQQPQGPPSPYDAAPCPTTGRPPEPGTTITAAVLDGAVAVRLCPDLDDPRGDGLRRASPDDVAEVEDADALVHDVAEFVADLRRLPAGLPEQCTRDRGPFRGQSFGFYAADGTQLLVRAPGCKTVDVEGRQVDSERIRVLYVTALERQRDRFAYTRAFDDELTCTSRGRGGPIRPGRERLVRAIACDLPEGAEAIPMDLEPVVLDPAQLALLDRAWSRPGDLPVRGPSGRHECLDPPEPPTFVLAVTDRSDVVQLVDTPCGYLAWLGSETHLGASIPTTLTALGIG